MRDIKNTKRYKIIYILPSHNDISLCTESKINFVSKEIEIKKIGKILAIFVRVSQARCRKKKASSLISNAVSSGIIVVSIDFVSIIVLMAHIFVF